MDCDREKFRYAFLPQMLACRRGGERRLSRARERERRSERREPGSPAGAGTSTLRGGPHRSMSSQRGPAVRGTAGASEVSRAAGVQALPTDLALARNDGHAHDGAELRHELKQVILGRGMRQVAEVHDFLRRGGGGVGHRRQRRDDAAARRRSAPEKVILACLRAMPRRARTDSATGSGWCSIFRTAVQCCRAALI